MGGNVAMIFALALPPLAVAAVGGIQLSYVVNVRSTAQDVADSAALAGAQQMSLSPVGAAERAQGWAQAQLAQRSGSTTFTVSAKAMDAHTLKVAIDTYTPSFFGDMLPAGGFRSHAEATAQQQAQAPLCVLVDGASSDYLKVTGLARVSGSCLVHSNGDIQVDALASIAASRVETTGSANGLQITPAAQTGAPSVADPFTGLPITTSTCGTSNNQNYGDSDTRTIPAGLHDGALTAKNNAAWTLAPGDHIFCSTFGIQNNGTITGTDVTLIFAKGATFTVGNNSTVSLSGRQSGNFAGFVWIVAPDNNNNFTIPTDPITKITGAIYSPNAKLILNGTKQAGQASDWTVVAAKALEVDGSANLQINTNYAGSPVTVPIGVGNRASASSPIQLVH